MGRDHLERPECESQQRDDYHQVDYAHHSMLPPGIYLPIRMLLGDERMLALCLRRSSSAGAHPRVCTPTIRRRPPQRGALKVDFTRPNT